MAYCLCMMFVDRIVDTSLAYARVSCDCVDPFRGHRCGQCANCRASNTNKWVSRLMHQASISKYVVSFCLTYTQNMLLSPKWGASMYESVEVIAPDDAVVKAMDIKRQEMSEKYSKLATLSKKDVQKFIKRLRSNDLNFKYYVKGEYGTANHHPHFHVLCFVDESETATEYEFRLAVLRAWYNGIYKLDDEDSPDMTRPENKGKVVKVNPIVSFGTFDEDCAKYCTKYVSKDSLADCLPSHLIPEFTLCSQKMAVDFYRPQMWRKRQLFLQLVEKWTSLSSQEFVNEFERIFTFVSNQNKKCFFPSFLKTEFFKGYYEYIPNEPSYCKKPNFKEPCRKVWRPLKGAKLDEWYCEVDGEVFLLALGERMFNHYQQMLYNYVNIKRAQFFGLSEDVLYVDYDIVTVAMQDVHEKIEKDRISNTNRTEGARRARQDKININSKYCKNYGLL